MRKFTEIFFFKNSNNSGEMSKIDKFFDLSALPLNDSDLDELPPFASDENKKLDKDVKQFLF
jgi:hypothetical protein